MAEKSFQLPSDRSYAKALAAAAPKEAAAYTQFSSAVMGRTDGALSPRERELVALGVALATQCPFCLESHTAKGHAVGVTREELAEVVYIASALCAGAAAAHGLTAMKLFEHATEQAAAR